MTDNGNLLCWSNVPAWSPGRIFVETKMIAEIALFRGEPIASAHGNISLANGRRRQLFHSGVTRTFATGSQMGVGAAVHVRTSLENRNNVVAKMAARKIVHGASACSDGSACWSPRHEFVQRRRHYVEPHLCSRGPDEQGEIILDRAKWLSEIIAA